MSKSVLVIDTPYCCSECPLLYKSEDIPLGNFMYQMTWQCGIKPVDVEDGYITKPIYNKPTWCPLLPLPERKNLDDIVKEGLALQYEYAQGYNDCLQDIQKGEQNE